jgi:hypothetical protein
MINNITLFLFDVLTCWSLSLPLISALVGSLLFIELRGFFK